MNIVSSKTGSIEEQRACPKISEPEILKQEVIGGEDQDGKRQIKNRRF
jgi:hypothetical protein